MSQHPDLRLCDLCIQVYDRDDYTWGNGEIRVFAFYEEGFLRIVGAGSRTLEDWWRDAQAVEMIEVPGIGLVARSFWEDAMTVVDAIADEINHTSLPFQITGHSKGGSEMECLGAWLKKERGLVAARLTVFEPAPVGLLGGLIDGVPGVVSVVGGSIPGITTDHHGDPVPHLPEDRQHPRSLTVFPDAAIVDLTDPLANHHLATAVRPALVRYLQATPTSHG